MRVPWAARRSNQSILKEINPEYSLEGLMAEAEAPILWPPGVKSQFIGKDPDAGKDWRQKEKRMVEDELVNSITNSRGINLSKLQEIVKYKRAWYATVHGVAKCQTQFSN